jgi:hypothetical protein
VLLPPGIYLVEFETSRPIATGALARGLDVMGWSEVALDESADSGAIVRFIGKLTRPIETHDTDSLRWSHVSPVPFDLFGSMRLSVYPFRLMQGATYGLWLVARMRAHEKRVDVQASLEREGFQIVKLSELKNNTRLPGRPGASVSFWYALGVWTKPSSYINTEYPFYFEGATEIVLAEPPSPIAVSSAPSETLESQASP